MCPRSICKPAPKVNDTSMIAARSRLEGHLLRSVTSTADNPAVRGTARAHGQASARMGDRQRVDRIVDVASVVLISVAAVMTALCGYQSGRWGGQQARLYSMANADRVLSAEAADKALAFNAINVNLFLTMSTQLTPATKEKPTLSIGASVR